MESITMSIWFYAAVTIITCAAILTTADLVDSHLSRKYKLQKKELEHTHQMVSDGGEDDE